MVRLLARVLLALHPAAFRAEYGADVTALFLERWREGGRRLRVHLIADLLRSATREWRDAIRGPNRAPGRLALLGGDLRHLAPP